MLPPSSLQNLRMLCRTQLGMADRKSTSRFAIRSRPQKSLDELVSLLDYLANPYPLPGSAPVKGIRKYDFDAIDDIRRAGEGSSYVVDIGKAHTGEIVAIKRTLFALTGRKERSDELGQFSFEDQLDLLYVEVRSLSHPPLRSHRNIVDLIGYGWTASFGVSLPFIVVECAELGTLDTYLLCNPPQSWSIKLRLLSDVAAGIDVLHRCKLIHGDVKMQNVLLFQTQSSDIPTAKVSDFGHTILWSSTMAYQPLYGGTPLFNAPEVFRQDLEAIPIEVMPKCDVYSYGLLAWGVAKDGHVYFERWWLESPDQNEIDFLESIPPDWLVNESLGFLAQQVDIDPHSRNAFEAIFAGSLNYDASARKQMVTLQFALNVAMLVSSGLATEDELYTASDSLIKASETFQDGAYRISFEEYFLEEKAQQNFGPFEVRRVY
jgi:serine/threonine protein kinase